jgi:hypothetical protein
MTRLSSVHLALVAMAVLGMSRDAKAWYFPEHVAIAHDGFVQLPKGIRDVVRDAVGAARREGLQLCSSADVRLEDLARRRPLSTKMLRTNISVDCVPYSALPGIAGDHSNGVHELRTVLTTKKAIELTSAVAYEWGRFREALDRLPNTSLERMSFVHDLDVDFYFIDPGYELRAQATRAHFVDAGRPIEEVARQVEGGSVDNALGQFIVRHVRSLELAARGSFTEAILEHAFALHFLEDSFSAGHLVMTRGTWKNRPNSRIRARHDFFDAKGLRVGRAMSVEPCDTLDASLVLPGLMPCWTTNGDGYLGVSPDATDRLHVARAVATVELELAFALDRARVLSVVASLSEPERERLAELVDPTPWWTILSPDRRRYSTHGARAMKLLEGTAAAMERLRSVTPIPEVAVGDPSPAGMFDPALLAGAFAPCIASADSVADDDLTVCGPSRTLALGTVGVSLLRPVLVEWPTTEADPSTLEGEASTDHGFAVQLLAAASAGTLLPPQARIELFAPAIGLAAGLSYRSGTYLPGRRDRAMAELNVGISESLHYDVAGKAGGNPHVTFLDQELRWPLAWEILTSYLLPLDLGRNQEAGTLILLGGARIHELLTGSAPVFWGGELEMAAIALSSGRGAYPLYASSPELRFYLGVADPAAVNPSHGHGLAPTFGIALTGGYATFL